MYKYFVIPALIVMVGCNSGELLNLGKQQEIELQVEGTTVNLSGKNFSGNENCEHIFLSASSTTRDNWQFRIEMNITTNGRIKDILYVNYSDNNRHYRTVDFISSEVFFIDNYNFSPLTRNLSFEFSGTLYELEHEQNTKSVSGKVQIEELRDIDCSFDTWELEAEINQLPFNVVEVQGWTTSTKTEWLGISDDGIKISIITANNLKDMPVGKYTFTKDDSLNTVAIEKYIGTYKATNAKIVHGEDWEEFQYEGELHIEEQVTGTTQRTKGSFTVKATKNDAVIYEVTNGKFAI